MTFPPGASDRKDPGSCDAFCHFGWGGSGSGARTGEQLQEENLRASLDTVRAAKALGCRRFLFSGSQAEYGMHQTRMDGGNGMRAQIGLWRSQAPDAETGRGAL